MFSPTNVILWLATPALLYADDPNRSYWRVHLLAYTLLVAACDIFLAHTLWAFVFGFPQRGEWTISHTLERLCISSQWCTNFGLRINAISPGHIKVLANG